MCHFNPFSVVTMTTCVWVLVYLMPGVTYRSVRWQPAVIKMFLWTAQLPMHPIMTPTLIQLGNGLANTSNETSKQMAKGFSVLCRMAHIH